MAVVNGQKYALIYIQQVDMCPGYRTHARTKTDLWAGCGLNHGTLASNERKRAQEIHKDRDVCP